MGPCQGPGGAHGLFLRPPQGAEHPSYLEMPAKAQMFSVRLPSLSTRHEGLPGPRGQASHRAGTAETIQGSEEERLSCPLPRPAPPPQPRPHHPRACLFTKPPPPGPKTHPHWAHTHSHPLAHGSTSAAAQSPLQAAGHAAPDAPAFAWTRRSQAAAVAGPQPRALRATLADSLSAHRCARAPATHRPPERTAAAASRKCRRGRPRSGSPCCEWPSCAPAWASSKGSPGACGGRPHGFLTPAAPSRAPRGARRGGQTQAQPRVRPGQAPPAEVQHRPFTRAQVPCPLPTPWRGAAYPTASGALCWQPPEGDQRINVLRELITAEGFAY